MGCYDPRSDPDQTNAPWNADPHIGQFANNAALTLDEERLLIDWIDEGAPRGDGMDSLTEVTNAKPNEWTLGQPDLILYGKPQSIPATGVIPYRYDRISVPLPEGTWVRGIEILPSNPRVLHHALVMHLNIERKDAKEDLWINTYPPPPTAHPNTVWINWPEEIMGTYLPGTKAQLFPDGTGKFLTPNSKLLVQYHYTTTGRSELDTPELEYTSPKRRRRTSEKQQPQSIKNSGSLPMKKNTALAQHTHLIMMWCYINFSPTCTIEASG